MSTNAAIAARSPRRTLWMAAAIALAFLLGVATQFSRAQRSERELQLAKRALLFTTLEARLGAATLEARRGSYEVARQLASEFYSGLQPHVASTPDAARRFFTGVLDQRDAVITELSRGEERAGILLTDLYLQWRSGMAELARAEGWESSVGGG